MVGPKVITLSGFHTNAILFLDIFRKTSTLISAWSNPLSSYPSLIRYQFAEEPLFMFNVLDRFKIKTNL